MKIYKTLNIDKKNQNSVLAIGNFDGVHLGHQKVLNQAFKKSRLKKLKFGLLTFEPMPVMFFNKKVKQHRVNSLKQKEFFLKKKKLDFLVIKRFDRKFSKLNYEKFIENVIFKKLNCKYLYVSKNFRFGKNRLGNVRKLVSSEKKFFFKTIITKPFVKNKKIISSTLIRKLLAKGDVLTVKNILGRFWEIEGTVVKGNQRGRKIGFPTCNIILKNYVIPKYGVYAVNVKYKKTTKKGIANLGIRPTFNGKKLLLEVNIFGTKKNLYNKKINVIFTKFIRSERKFKDLTDLKKQIKIDIKKAKKNV